MQQKCACVSALELLRKCGEEEDVDRHLGEYFGGLDDDEFYGFSFLAQFGEEDGCAIVQDKDACHIDYYVSVVFVP